MADGQITRTTVHLSMRIPETKELQRMNDERWAKAEKESDGRIAARKASPPQAANS
jgi:hypothetical protein